MLAQAHDIIRYLIVPLFLLAALGLARAVGIGLLRRLERMPSQPPVEPRDTAAADPFSTPIGELPEVPNWRRALTPNDFAFPHGAAAWREAGGGRAVPSVPPAVRDHRILVIRGRAR